MISILLHYAIKIPACLVYYYINSKVLEDELSEAKLEASKANSKQISNQSNYEIEISELRSKINELEEESLIESGRSRIAGTRYVYCYLICNKILLNNYFKCFKLLYFLTIT